MFVMIEGNQVEVQQKNGKYHYTFTATETTQHVPLPALSSCNGTTRAYDIQLEKSDEPTPFVLPEVSVEQVKGLFKNLRSLNFKFSNLESGLTNRLDINEAGYSVALIDTERQLTNRIVSTAGENLSRIEHVDGRVNQVTETIDGMQRTISSKADRSTVTQLSDNINLRVSKGDVLSQINIEAGRTLIQSDKILLDADNVIFSGTAWIPSAVIGDIEADKITSGRLDAGQITVVNLDVNSLSGNTTNFVQSNWNTAAGGNVSITGGGIVSTANDSSQVYIQNGIVGARNPQGASLGHFGYNWTTDRAFLNLETSLGTNFSISARKGSAGATTRYTMMDIFPGSSETYIRTDDFRHVGATDSNATPLARFSGDVRIDGELRMEGNGFSIHNPYGVNFQHGGQVYTNSAGQTRLSSSGGMLQLGVSGSWKLNMDSTYLYAHVNLSMEGNTITNQSDIRLKSNVEDSQLDALREIERLRFIDFEWDKSKGAINENKPGERQFGLIAQYTPFLQTKVGESESYLSVDLTKQINLNSKATQELLHYTRLLEKRIEVLENERTA